MNTSILRQVFTLAVLLVAYVSIMGHDCGDPEPPNPCAAPAVEDDLCSMDNSANMNGYCSEGTCVPGSPEDPVNRCRGLDVGDPCKVTEELTGTCVVLAKALRCVVIVNLPGEAPDDDGGEPLELPTCNTSNSGVACTKADGNAGTCEGGTCK